MQITVNGQVREFERLRTVSDLLSQLELDPRQVVVEVNERVVKRQENDSTPVADGDTVEIVRFVGGG